MLAGFWLLLWVSTCSQSTHFFPTASAVQLQLHLTGDWFHPCVFALVPLPSDCEGDGLPGGYSSRESILRPEAKRAWRKQRQRRRYNFNSHFSHVVLRSLSAVLAERSTLNASCGQQRSTPCTRPDEVTSCGGVFVVADVSVAAGIHPTARPSGGERSLHLDWAEV